LSIGATGAVPADNERGWEEKAVEGNVVVEAAEAKEGKAETRREGKVAG